MNRLIIASVTTLSLAAVLGGDFASFNSPIQAPAHAWEPGAQASTSRIKPITYQSTVTPQSEDRALPPMDLAEAARRWEELDAWMTCSEQSSCKVDDSDPRAKDIAIRDKILAAGRWFLNHGSGDSTMRKRAYAAASRLLSFPEEQVQALALQWLGQLPAQAETLATIEKNLSDMVDPDLAMRTLLELKRHMNTDREEAALDLVEALLFEGSVFASREVARSAAMLMHEGNRARFEQWLGRLKAGSAKERLLRESMIGSEPDSGA